MTDKTLHIVPYISDHGRLIMQSQMNHVLMQKDASYLEESMDLEEKNLAFSGFINNNLVASAGMIRIESEDLMFCEINIRIALTALPESSLFERVLYNPFTESTITKCGSSEILFRISGRI